MVNLIFMAISSATRLKQKILERTANKYNKKFEEVIATPRQWNAGFKTTRSKSGQVVTGSFRDIVDLGELQRSQRLEIEFNLNQAVISWSAPHASLVYFGFIHTSGDEVPARPWAKVGIFELGDAELTVI